jgi:hypothetical protein
MTTGTPSQCPSTGHGVGFVSALLVFGIIVIVLILLVCIMMLVGSHGPGVHTP